MTDFNEITRLATEEQNRKDNIRGFRIFRSGIQNTGWLVPDMYPLIGEYLVNNLPNPELLKITEIDLNDGNIVMIPSSWGNLVNLRELYLSDNQITDLPSEIDNLINLRG